MIRRSVAMCDGEYIGIESIYTVTADGRQINIQDKVEALRKKGRDNQLFCPCGCGTNLTVVASDKNLRTQHFRKKVGTGIRDCTVTTETQTSIDSKIVLKCWLDDKLRVDDLESRVPLDDIVDSTSKPEFTFLSRRKKLGIRYWYTRANIDDEKLEALSNNLSDIRTVYIVDYSNAGTNGQYPEFLMKIQKKQKYSLFLQQCDGDYKNAILCAVFYEQNLDGAWAEVEFASGKLTDIDIIDGNLFFAGVKVDKILDRERTSFFKKQEIEKNRREEAEREVEKRRECIREEQEQRKREEEEFKKSLAERLEQPDTPVRDKHGDRWIKCWHCGKIDTESQFASYGGAKKKNVNLGLCKECSRNPDVQAEIRKNQDQELLQKNHNVKPALS